MKLRLPHKFQAALIAALASVSFTTLSTGTIAVATGAALLAGQQAQAEESTSLLDDAVKVYDGNIASTLVVDDWTATAMTVAVELDVQAVKNRLTTTWIDGRKSIDTIINAQGTWNGNTNTYTEGINFNGSSGDKYASPYLQVTSPNGNKDNQAAANVSGSVMFDASTPWDDYASMAVVLTFNGGNQIGATWVIQKTDGSYLEYSGTTSGIQFGGSTAFTPNGTLANVYVDMVDYVAVFEGVKDGDASKSIAKAVFAREGMDYGMTFSGDVFTIEHASNQTFHNATFSSWYQDESGRWKKGSHTWGGGDYTYYVGEEAQTLPAGNSRTFWRRLFGDADGGEKAMLGNTIRLTRATGDVYYESTFGPYQLGGIIVEEGNSGTYVLGRHDGSCAIHIKARAGEEANMYVASNLGLSSNTSIDIDSSGTWKVFDGKSLTLALYNNTGNLSSIVNTPKITFKNGVTVSMVGGGTVDMTHTNNLTIESGATVEVGENTLAKFASNTTLAGTIDNAGSAMFNGLSMSTGSSLMNSGTLTLGGNVSFAHAPITNSGTVAFANDVLLNLDSLDAVKQDDKWVYTLFTGSDVTMSGLSASNLSITGGTLGKNWDFTTPNQISYTLKPEKEWTKDVAAYWNYTDPNWNGQQFNEGDAAVFNLGENVVLVNAAVKASSIKLAPEGGGYLMLGADEGGSLSAANISVESTGANLLTSIEITGVEEFSVGEGAVWGITANQTLGAGTNNGTISIGKGNTLTLTDGATAAALLQSVQGSGNIRLTADTDLEGVLNDKEHATRTQATGTLTLQGITLRLGKMSTDGSYQKWYVDLSSFDTIALDGGTLWVHSPETVVNNVTVDNHAGTIHVRDSDNDQQAGKPDTLKIAGKLTLNANLTISSTWKNKVSIAELAGTGKLTLSGGNNQVINIGGGTVGSMELSTAPTHATVTGNLTVSSGDLTLRSGDLSVSGSVAVNKALDLSAGGDSNATLNIKSGGTVTLANTSNASFWLDDSAHLNLEQNGTLNLEKYHVSIAGRANGSSIVAATNNQQYGTNNTNFTVTNADVTALGTITLANKLVNSTINTGAYAVTLTNGGNVLAGATVGAGGTLNINANSTLLASISNESQVTFTSGVTVTMDASMVQDGAVGYLDTGDAFTGDGNGFKTERIGKFVTVITGPGSVTANNIVVNAGSDVLYLNNRGVAFIEGAVETVTYDTYYQKSGVADLSDIIAMAGGNTVHTVQVGANTQLNLNGYVKTVNSIGETSVEDCAIINLQDGGKVSDVVTQTAMTAVVGDLSINGTDTPDTQGNATQLHMNKSNSLAVVGNVNVDSKVRFVKGGDEGVVLVTSIDSQTGAQYTLDKATMMVASDKVQKVAEGDVEVANYTSSRVVDNTEASGSFTLSNASLAMQALEEVHAVTGDISFLNTGNQYEPILKALEIAGGKTVSFNQAGSIESMATETTVTVTGTLKAGKDATLNANLVMGSKSTLDVSGTGGAGLLMGSSVTLNPGVTLSGDDMEAITALGFMHQYTLFTGVDAFSYDGDTPTPTPIAFDSETWVKASEVFSNSEFTGGKDYYVFYSGAQNGSNVGAVYVMQLPEPTTGTLSLLALAALAARRRRK